MLPPPAAPDAWEPPEALLRCWSPVQGDEGLMEQRRAGQHCREYYSMNMWGAA